MAILQTIKDGLPLYALAIGVLFFTLGTKIKVSFFISAGIVLMISSIILLIIHDFKINKR